MSCKISARINAGCKMLLSVQQCMKNTLPKKNQIFFCSKLSTLVKSPNPTFSVRCSHHTYKNRTLSSEIWRTGVLSRQCIKPQLSNALSSSDSKVKAEENKNEDEPEKKLSLYQKFKKMYKEYWYVLVPVHLVTSSIWFGGFYYLAISGIDIPALLETLGAPDSWIENLKNSKAGNVVLAYTLYKVATPLRYTVTLGGTTISINYLKKWGWIKPVPNTQQIKKMYQDQKGAFKDLKASYQDKMQVTKNEFLKTKHEMKKHYNEVKEEFHKTVKETRQDIKGGIKEGINEGSKEWKLIGRVFARKLNEGWQEISGGKK